MSAQNFYNTGAATNVNGAFQDSKWQVSMDGTTWYQALQVQNPPIPPWEANTSSYSWIAATLNASGGSGNYFFRTFIDLTGYDPTTASISFNCALDNTLVDYALNGTSISQTGCVYSTFAQSALQTVSSDFIGGQNELKFHVTGDGTTDGFVLGNARVTATALVETDPDTTVPEPASLVLLSTGMIGVVGVARRRRKM